jgi:hypothetical protein
LETDAGWLKQFTDGFEVARERIRSATRELLESESDAAR